MSRSRSTPADPKCCICGDAYGTRFVCDPCRADPANADWREASELESSTEVEVEGGGLRWGEGDRWEPTPLFSLVLMYLLEGKTRREVAEAAGCAVGYVQKVAEEVGLA